MDKFSFLILNFCVNSLFAFFTACLLIEGLIFLFRVRAGRLSAWLRMIPLLKLPLDLCRYDFARWSYTQGINPFLCEEGTRSVIILLGWFDPPYFFLPIRSAIEGTISGDKTFTLADCIGYNMDPLSLKIFSFALLAVSLLFLLRKYALYRRFLIDLKSVTRHAPPFEEKIELPSLATEIRKNNLQISASSSLSGSPFTTGLFSPKIYLPSSLLQTLSQKEREAVLAHELAHIRHKDNLIRLILDFIGTLFWWIPTKWQQRRIKESWEISCDLACTRYGADPLDLASAICKSANFAINRPFASCLTKKASFRRIDQLLNPFANRFKKLQFVCMGLAALLAFLLIFLGRFWIF